MSDSLITEFNGSYLEDCIDPTETLKTAEPFPLNIGDSERLWKLSEELTRQKLEY